MDNLKTSSALMTFFVLILIAIGQSSIDIYLPSLPTMVHALQTTDNLVKLTIAIFLLGFASSQLIYGPLSDFLGRRPVLLVGLTISTIGSILCAATSSIDIFLLARLLQGLGIGAASVLARAIMRDTFSGKDLMRVASYASMAWASVPILAPILGAYIQSYFEWRMNFMLLACASATLIGLAFYYLPETKVGTQSLKLDMRGVVRNYKTIITHKLFLGNVNVMMIVYGITITFSVVSPFLLQGDLKLSPIHYSWALFFVTLGFFSGSFLNSRLTKNYTAHQLIWCGFCALFISNLLMLSLAIAGMFSLSIILFPMFLIFFSMGLIYPNCIAGCLSPFPDKAGSASAMYGFLVFIGGGAAGIIASHLSAKTQIPLSITIFIESLIGLFIFIKLILAKQSAIAPVAINKVKSIS